MRDSVRAHLVSDVPVGVLLSGGVDSCTLAALAAEETSEPLRTFSIGFEERSYDELADARLVAERYGTVHRELVLRPDAALLLPELAAAFDEPFADSSALPTYLVSRLAAEDVKVALSGEGGDELFGGYYTYAAALLAERFGRPAALIRPLVERLPTSTRKASLDYRAKRFVRAAKLPPLERHHGWKEIFSADVRAELTGRRSHIRSRRPAARALRRDGGRRPARASAGRRHRHVPRRRPAREDGPRVDGELSRGARPVPRHGRERLRARAAGAAQGARTVEEAPAAQGSGAAPARAHRATDASAASRFRPPHGCAATSRRSRARRWRRTSCGARASSSPSRCTASSTSTSPVQRTGAAICGACLPSPCGTSTTSSRAPRPLRLRHQDEVLRTSSWKTGQARFARVPMNGRRRVIPSDRSARRRGQAAPSMGRNSAMNKPPAARLRRAVHKRRDDAAALPIAAMDTRAKRAYPVFTARNAQHFGERAPAR